MRALARVLLWLYPIDFRRELGPALVRDLELEAVDVRGAGSPPFAVWLMRTASSLLRNAVAEWSEGPDPRGLSGLGRREKAGAMDTLRQDLSFAARSLRRRPAFTIIAVFTLALGIGSTTAMFSVVRGILLRPLPYAASDRLVTIWKASVEDAASLEGGMLSHADFHDVRDGIGGIESMALVNAANLTVTEEGGAEVVAGARATPGLFEVLRTPLLLGRDFSDLEDEYGGPAVVIVAADYWRDRFGPLDEALGSTIRIGGTARQVVGVAPSGFSYPAEARLWIPAQNDDGGCGRGCVNRGSIARLADGASVEATRVELETLAVRLGNEYPVTNSDSRFALAKLHDVVVGDVRTALWLVFGAVGMVLLIACANVANLILVRGRGRVAEVAIRTTLGAGRRRIVKQLMTESGLIAVLGGAVGIGLAYLGVDLVLAIAPENIPRLDEIRLDLPTLGFAGVLVLLTTAIFGATPAILGSGVELTKSLRDGGRGDVSGRRSGRARSTILTVEVALSVLLLVGAGLMVRSLVRTTEVDPGFEVGDIAVFRLSLPRVRYDPAARVQFLDRLRERLEAAPEIGSAAVFLGPPLSSVSVFGGFSRPDLPPPDPGEGPSANYRAVGPGALEMLRVPVIAGRSFRETDRRDAEPVVLITQLVADRQFPGEDPIGRTIQIQVTTGFPEEGPRTIVGVIGDFRGSNLRQPPVNETLIPFAQAGAGFPHVLLDSPNPTLALEAAREVLRSLDPELPMMQPGTMAELADRQLAQPRFYLLLLAILATLAVVLAAVGMYGVVAYAVSQRTKEIGVRMALGACTSEVVRLVLRQGMRPAVIGVTLGVLGAVWLGNVMRGLLYGVAPRDPLTLIAVPLFLMVVVALACAIPARRATRVSPSTALRGE